MSNQAVSREEIKAALTVLVAALQSGHHLDPKWLKKFALEQQEKDPSDLVNHLLVLSKAFLHEN